MQTTEVTYQPLDVDGKLTLTTQQLANERIAVLGVTGSGKSNTIALLLEQMIEEMPFVVIDTHGEYGGLRTRFNIPIVGKSRNVDVEVEPEQMGALAEYAFNNRQSFIIDLLFVTDADKRLEYVYNFVSRLFELSKRSEQRRPFGIVLEEAQNYIPQDFSKSDVLKELSAITLEGRKFGLSMIIASQRAAEVSKKILGQCSLVFLHAVYIYADFKQYQGMLPYSLNETKEIALNLDTGQAIVRYKRQVSVHQMRQSDLGQYGATPTLDGELRHDQPFDAGLFDDLRSVLAETVVSPSEQEQKFGHVNIQELITERDSLISQVRDLKDVYDQIKHELEDQRNHYSQEHERHTALLDQKQITINALKQTIDELMPLAALGRGVPASAVEKTKVLLEEADEYRSPLQTTRGIRKQERAFEGLLADLKSAPIYQQRILCWLTYREGTSFDLKSLCRYLGLSFNTVYNSPPIMMIERGVLARKGRGAKAVYWSVISDHLRDEYPDLDQNELLERVYGVLPKLT